MPNIIIRNRLYNILISKFIINPTNYSFNRVYRIFGQNAAKHHTLKNLPIETKIHDFSNKHYKSILVASGALGIGFAGYYLFNSFMVDDSLNPEEFVKVTLIHKEKLTTDTTLYRFQYPKSYASPEEFDFPVISHVQVKDHTMQIMRPYTTIPITTNILSNECEKGELNNRSATIDLAVKKYPKGPMSGFLSQIAIGGEVEIRGPYKTWRYEPNQYRLISLIAAGTGIAPFYQLIHTALQADLNFKDKTRFSLIYYCHEPENILFKERLLELQKKFPERLDITISVTSAAEENIEKAGKVRYLIGRVNYSHIAEFLKKEQFNPVDSKILVCGPDGFLGNVCGLKAPDDTQGPVKAILGHMGLSSDSVYKL